MDLEAAMLLALSSLPACTQAAYDADELPLPLVVVSQDNRRVLARADGAPYLEEAEAAVHVYAKNLSELQALCRETHAALTAMGLSCLSQTRDQDEKVWAHHQLLRYRAVLCGDTIYQ